MRNNCYELEICVHLQGYDLLDSQRHGGMTPVTGVLQWRNTGFLEKRGKGLSGRGRQACPFSERAAGVHETLPGDERRAD